MAIIGREGTDAYGFAQINKHATSALLLLPSSVLLCVLQYFKLNIFEPIRLSGSWRKARWSHDRRRSTKATSDFESSQKVSGQMLWSIYLKVHSETLLNAICLRKIIWLFYPYTYQVDMKSVSDSIFYCFLQFQFHLFFFQRFFKVILKSSGWCQLS